MSKSTAGHVLSFFDLDESGTRPLYRQIYSTMREAILSGKLERGLRLPSSRTLATELGISRNTIINAFEQLDSEGFLESKPGSGTYVALELSRAIRKPHASRRSSEASMLPTVKLSRQGKAMMRAKTPMARAGAPIAFSPGIPALDEFPLQRWNRCVGRANLRLDAAALNYGPTEGFIGLRNALSSYLATARGVRCSPEQILLVSGVQQGLDLIARLLIDPGDPVWLEDPGHPGARGVFIASQARIVPVPVDDEGLDVDAGIARAKNASVAYVTPSHQSPGGAIMSIGRRMQLLQWAQRNNSWIVEDDYDSEFRYQGRPLAALQGLVEGARVLYLGTFSKVLAPGLRLAYLVVPEELIDVFSTGRRLLDTHTTFPLQLAMAEFIDKGYLSTHIRRMRQIYRERQAVLLEQVDRHLSQWVAMSPSPSGMHLVGYFDGIDDRELSSAAAARGVNVPALSEYYLDDPKRSGLIFGYACAPPEKIETGVVTLKNLFEQFTG